MKTEIETEIQSLSVTVLQLFYNNLQTNLGSLLNNMSNVR